MEEIEVKILEIDEAALRKRLDDLGAKQSFAGELVALFYDYPDGRIKAAEEVLRLRKEGPETMLTYKKRLSKDQIKVMEEHETPVADFDAMQVILERIGLQTFSETRKFRTEFMLEGAHIVIDDYHGDLAHIPPFLEIEAPDVETLHKLVEKLGFDQAACLSWDTYDLMRHYASPQN